MVLRASAYVVRVKGHRIAVGSRNVHNIPGSTQRPLQGTSVFHTNDSCSVSQELPLTDTGWLDTFTIELARKNKPTASQSCNGY